jgi:hypothetical protein
MPLVSIAMWNKNKAVMMLAIIVSGIIVAFHLHSQSLPLNSAERPEISYKRGLATDIARVNSQFQ